MSGTLSNNELREFAHRLVQEAGRIAAARIGRVSVERKSDNSPVTDADREVQAAIFDAIARAYPNHAVIGEESLRDSGRHASHDAAAYCWVVDPIDGTRNYAQAISIYAVSIAVLHEGEPVAGAIWDASSRQVYSAARDAGAECNGRPLRIPDVTDNADVTLLVSSFRRQPVPQVVRSWMDSYLFRNYGSLCLHLAWVAAGLVDAAYAAECRLWDIAAGALIVAEAGGAVTNNTGGPIWPVDVTTYDGAMVPILAGAPAMHAKLLESLRAAERGD